MKDKLTLRGVLLGINKTSSNRYLGSLQRPRLLDYGKLSKKKPQTLKGIIGKSNEQSIPPMALSRLLGSLDTKDKRPTLRQSLAEIGGGLPENRGLFGQYSTPNFKDGYHSRSLRDIALRNLVNDVKPAKRKVFISYHHKNDQVWYDFFSEYFTDYFDLFYDNSLERKVDSTNSDYLDRKIREEYITGSSVTVVLCGSETGKRRWVDWEIYATLYRKHGLLGIILPTCSKTFDSKFIVPERLHENIVSGYAVLMEWTADPGVLRANIETAFTRSKNQQALIRNFANKMKRSLT